MLELCAPHCWLPNDGVLGLCGRIQFVLDSQKCNIRGGMLAEESRQVCMIHRTRLPHDQCKVMR